MFLVLTGSSASRALRLGSGGDPSNGVRSLSAIADSEKNVSKTPNTYNFPQLSCKEFLSLYKCHDFDLWQGIVCAGQKQVSQKSVTDNIPAGQTDKRRGIWWSRYNFCVLLEILIFKVEVHFPLGVSPFVSLSCYADRCDSKSVC